MKVYVEIDNTERKNTTLKKIEEFLSRYNLDEIDTIVLVMTTTFYHTSFEEDKERMKRLKNIISKRFNKQCKVII